MSKLIKNYSIYMSKNCPWPKLKTIDKSNNSKKNKKHLNKN